MNAEVNAIIERFMRDYGMTRAAAEAEYDLEVYSDMYKDAHGARPRWAYDAFRAMSAEERAAEFDKLTAYFESAEYKAECEATAAWIAECEAAERVRWDEHCAVESAKADGLPAKHGMTLAEVLALREGEALYPTPIIAIEEARGWL